MRPLSFEEALENIFLKDQRYTLEAYLFLREALDFTVRHLKEPPDGMKRHVSGQELLSGVRQLALEQFGPLAKTVLGRWGIHQTRDFGEIVFNLVGEGALGKTEEDSIEDFMDGYDFDEAFLQPFMPLSARENQFPTPVEQKD